MGVGLAKVYTPDESFLGELLVAPDVDVESLVMLLCQVCDILNCNITLYRSWEFIQSAVSLLACMW